MKLSTKQRTVLAFIQQHGSITKKEAVIMIGGSYYHNKEKYVGEVLSRMVNSGILKRVKKGLFEIGDKKETAKGITTDHPKLF